MQNLPDMVTKQIAAAIIEIDGKILIAQRGKEDGLRGLWEFPGGKVESGESLQECLKREMREEFGIEVQVGDYFCTSSFAHKDVNYDMNMFFVHGFTGQIVLHEHLAVAWVTVAELENYPMPAPDLPVLAQLKIRQGLL